MPVDFQQALPDKQAGMISPFGGLYSFTKKKKNKKNKKKRCVSICFKVKF